MYNCQLLGKNFNFVRIVFDEEYELQTDTYIKIFLKFGNSKCKKLFRQD